MSFLTRFQSCLHFPTSITPGRASPARQFHSGGMGRDGRRLSVEMDDEEAARYKPDKPKAGYASDSDNDVPGDSIPRKGKKHSVGGASFWYRRAAYISDSYLSQSVYQSYALLLGAVILTVSGGFGYHGIDSDVTYFDGMWATFTWISTGILSSGVVPATIASRAVAATIVIVGILYFSVVLALVVEAVQFKMKSLREGKSLVVEKGHVVMLGWSEKSLLFIREIIMANESEGGGVVVVLCQDGKEKMERELNLMLKKREMKGTSVVFRQGSRLMVGDLDKVSVHTARSVVVFSNSNVESDKADAEVLQVVLNLSNLDLIGHVVAEVKDKDNEALIHLIGRGNVETVVSHDVIGRLMLMSVRQPGLAEVYGSVLGFDGDEFYAQHWKELVGVPFKDVHLMLPDAIPLGLKDENGVLELNPKHDRVCGENDELLVLAEDNDTYRPKPKQRVTPGRVPWLKGEDNVREYILFAGWRRDLRDILLLLDAMCAAGSEIHIMAGVALSDRDRLLADGGLEVETLRNIKLVHHVGNTAMRRHLELLGIERFTSVIVFADEEEEGDIMQSDSKCLATLLLIRNIQKAKRAKLMKSPSSRKMMGLDKIKKDKDDKNSGRIPIVTEILDPRTQQTIQQNAEMRAVSDFLQSNDMVSKILAMVCEDRTVKEILDEMLAPRGASMACVPASRYAAPGEKLSFFDMACRCQEYGEILIGYLEDDDDAGDAHSGRNFKPPSINPVNKKSPFEWDGHVCCLLTGGPAVEEVMSSKAKFMDTSFAKKMGLGLTSVLEVGEEDFVKLVATAFKRFDDDNSGALELNEILEAFRTLPLKATESQVVAKFHEFDVDNSQALDEKEFEMLMRSLREEAVVGKVLDVNEQEFDEMAEEIFTNFDEDNSGELDLEEICRAFQKLPLKEMSEDEVRAKFTKFDIDKSGALDQGEFRDLMRELRKENAKKSLVVRPRMDAVERRNVRDMVSMAEVKLAKLHPRERDIAMAHIMCFVNEGRFDGPSFDGGNQRNSSAYTHKYDDDRNKFSDDRRYAGDNNSPLLNPDMNSPPDRGMNPYELNVPYQTSGFPPLHGQRAGGGIDSAREERGGLSGPVSRGNESNGHSETSEYASYLSDRLIQMPAMRRNQIIQVFDLLADSFACGQSVPATRLLGVLSSFQAFPGGPGGTGGASMRKSVGAVMATERFRSGGRDNKNSRDERINDRYEDSRRGTDPMDSRRDVNISSLYTTPTAVAPSLMNSSRRSSGAAPSYNRSRSRDESPREEPGDGQRRAPFGRARDPRDREPTYY